MIDQKIGLTLDASLNPSGVLDAIKTIQNGFNGLKIDPKLMSGLTKEFSEIQRLVKDYQKIMGKENISKADLKNLQKLEGSINSSFSKITELQNQINGKSIILKVDATQLDELHKKTEAARQALNDAFGKVNIGNSTSGLTQIENALEKAVGRSKTLKTSFNDAFESLNKGEVNQFSNKLDNIFNNLTSKIKAGKLIPTVDSLLDSFKRLGLIDININTNSAAEKLLALKDGIRALKDGIANGLNGEELKGLVKNLEDATRAEKEFESAAITRGQDNLSKRVAETERLATATRNATRAQTEFQQSTLSAQDQVKQLQQSTQYFFSLRNMINLLKRGIREAVTTVKELDAAMTETAVVTQYSVGDMWAKLPEYTANANALGATVQDMYESTTLYYQQGLNTEQAMSIAAETMKMARIAGLEAAEATDMMTAALRGFNMELNETSAERINDVYSNLAAKTASNTEELGTAMQRTASIAHSAGMSFEGTAAFLAQAIETTREPAENLGTAMKTIVARFQELKKNPLEIAEVDGEEVSYNKVDTALQSIGVSLKDANGQFRDLDKVFLDISQRWDGLSQTQQRYIATMAAGSRQQSRFIAMMSNYGRTVELMNYANDSAGASTTQFNKTLESLEAKINKFQNAWKQFLMGIMNDSWTKKIVDAGTTVLNTVNKIIDALSFGGKLKLIKSALSVFTAFTTLKFAGRGVNALIGGLAGFVDPKSSIAAGFKGGFKGGANQGATSALAGRITTPIVSKLDQLIAVVKGAKVQAQKDKISTVADYNKAAANFQKTGVDNNLSMSQIGALFKDLSSEHATGVFNSGAGTVSAMKRTSLDWFNNVASQVGLDAKSQKLGQQLMNGIYRGMKKGQISPSEGIKLLGKPEEWGKAFGTPVAQQFSENFTKQFNAYRKQQFKKLFNSTEVKRATQKALLASNPQMNLAGDQAWEAALKNNSELAKQYKAEQRKQYVRMRNQMMQNGTYLNLADLNNQAIKSQTTMEQLGTSISQVGQKFTSAGFSIQMFGQQLSMLSPALSGVGNAISMVGTAVTTLGMGVNGLGSIASGVGNVVSALGGLSVALPVLAVLGAAVGALAYDIKKTQDIKKAAEEVTNSFNEIQSKTSESINNLEQMRGEFEQLSAGVDKFGNNVSLDTSEYDRYREIVRQIAEINPSIVDGYNSQGDAIINNNNALRDTLELQRQIKKEATTEYLSTSSLRKLIEARDKDTAYTGRNKGSMKLGDPRIYEAKKYVDQLMAAGISQDVIARFGLDPEKLANKDTGELLRLTENIDKFADHIDNLQLDEHIAENLESAATDLHDASSAFNEAVQPVYENLSAYASENKLTAGMDDSLEQAYQNGLRKIAASPKTAGEMQKAAQKLSQKLFALIGKDSAYEKVLKRIEKAKDTYADNLNEQAYLAEINSEEIAGILNGIVTDYKDSADETERIIAEMAANTLADARNLENTGLVNLSEAFDTVAKHMDTVISAADEFKKVAEGLDPARGTTALKSIYDTVYGEDSTHALGGGDAVYWKGVKSFVSEELYRSGDKETIDALIKKVAPALEEGADGILAANDFLVNRINESDFAYKDYFTTENGELGIVGTIDEATFQKIAESADGFNLDVDTLGAIIGRLGQFGLDFSNYDEIRRSYASDDRVYQGGYDTTKNGQTGLLISEEQALIDALSNNKSPKEFADEVVPALQKQNVDILPTLKENGENNKEIGRVLEKYGINADNYIEALSGMMVPKEDIQTIGKDILGANVDNFDQQYAELIAGKDDPIGQITNDKLSQLVDLVSAIAKKEGADSLTSGKANASDFLSNQFKDYITDPNGEIRQFAKGNFDSGDALNEAQDHITNGILTQLANYEAEVQTGLNEATKAGDLDRVEAYEQELKATESYINYVNSLIGIGQTNYNDKKLGGSSEKNKTLEDGFGNTDFFNRPYIFWGDNPKDYKQNLKAAKTWDWTEQELTGTESTYMSKFKTFTDKSGQDFTLAFTPMLKDSNGNPQILDKNTVNQYLDDIIKESTHSDGAINLDELMANDTKGLLMGASFGTGADSPAARLSEIEEYFSQMLTGYNEFGDQLGIDFKTVLSQLNPQEIAESADLTNTLASLTHDVMEGGLPKLSDLQTLGIAEMYQQFGGQVQEEADQINQTSSSLRDRLHNAYEAFANTDKSAMAMDVVGNDPITKSITNLGERLRNWWDSLHGAEANANSGTNTQPTVPTAPSQPSAYTVDTSNAETSFLSLQTLVNDVTTKINAGATFTISTPGIDKLKQAATAANKLTQASGTKTIGVKTGKADTSSVKAAQNTINNTQAKIQVGANVDAATAAARRVQRTIDGMSAKIDISANFTGSWSKDVNITVKKTTINTNNDLYGQNNHISYRAPIHTGSLAKGTKSRFGQIGPQNRGGLTLTGEKGFEIAWLPKENRSMILGTTGPQMLNLPSDAVVWTHEQSKKILKQKAIPAGSHATVSGKVDLSSLGRGSYTGGAGSTSQTVTKAANKITHSATQAAAKVGKVSVWWENIARKTEATQRKADTAYSNFERYIKTMQATLRTTGTKGGGNAYIANMTKVLGYQQAQYNKATRELKHLDNSKSTTTVKYKKGKKQTSAKVKLGNYIKYDSESGTYIIDQKKISAVAKNPKKGKAQAQAIKDAAEKKINEKTSKQTKAEDAIKKAKEALDKFGKELYDTFFAWENELTKIWNLTQKITQSESNISRIKGYEELLNKRLATGLEKANDAFKAESLNTFQVKLDDSMKKIRRREKLITEQQKAVNQAWSIGDEATTLKNVTDKLDIRKKVDKKAKAMQDAADKKAAAEERKKAAQKQIDDLKAQKKKAKTEKEKKKIQEKINKAIKKRRKANADIQTYSKEYTDAKTDYDTYVGEHKYYLNDTQVAGYEAYAQELQDKIDAQAAAQKYLKVSQNADGTLNVDFNTDALEEDKEKGLLTGEKAQAIQDYVKKLVESSEELNQAYSDLTNDLGEMYDTLSDLQQEWVNYANELWDISNAEIKKETENMKKLSDSLSNTLKDLLDDVKRKLDERRQREDNAKTEQDISRKQQRLAALRADTSGGHQVEIAQLEKEISEAQQNYQRSLEDQLLEKLQQQGDEAAKQRERQIELQEIIADSINNAALVDMWMANPELYRDEIYNAFKASKNYDNAPKAIKEDYDRQFEVMMAGLSTNQDKQKALADSMNVLETALNNLKESIDKMHEVTSKKSIEQLRELGFTDDQIRQSGYSVEDFIDAGTTSAKDLRNAGFSVADLAKTGKFSDEDIKKAGYSISEFKEGTGVTGKAGAEKASAAGYQDKEIAETYGITAAMGGLGLTGAKVQELTGAKAGTIQTAVNKSGVDQKNMAGVQVGTVDVNGKDKGGVAKDSHISANGSYVSANKGSTLYYADWDEKTGKVKGKWTAVAIDKLTANLIKKYPIDGRQALEYAIKNFAVGSKINANMDALVKAAGIGGNTYKLKSGHVASMNGSGALHFNGTKDKKDGVYIWNPEKGTKTFREYNKAKFKEWGKDAQVGREYRAVLKKKGVKGYATGGLATETGPAWLHGTPSKPELVLNARDTKNFIALKDILNKAMHSTNEINNSYGGDTTYEININVDKIANDYDVDKMAERIKKIIVKDSSYRNVTQVRNFR